jgi:hypothetical protein
VNNGQLQPIIGANVVELDFVRRHPKLGWSDIRGMFGTTNPGLLNSDFGFQVIHFKPPKGVGMGYDYRSKNLCVIFDIFRQEYRVFGAEQVNIHKTWPLGTEEEVEEFKAYFYEFIINMSNAQKIKFMGYVGGKARPVSLTPPANQQPQVTAHQPSITDRLKKKFTEYYERIKGFFSRKKR